MSEKQRKILKSEEEEKKEEVPLSPKKSTTEPKQKTESKKNPTESEKKSKKDTTPKETPKEKTEEKIIPISFSLDPSDPSEATPRLPEEEFEIGEEIDVSFSDEEEDPISEGKVRKKSWSARTKQGIGNSAVGKALFNKFVDKETKKLINALMILIEKDSGRKVAKKVKADIFRIAVKMIVLHEEKYVSGDDFLKLRTNFRRICSATRNGYRTGVIEEDTAARISELIQQFAEGIKEIIGKFVSPATLVRIDGLVKYLGAADFLARTSKLQEFATVAYVLAYYLQET